MKEIDINVSGGCPYMYLFLEHCFAIPSHLSNKCGSRLNKNERSDITDSNINEIWYWLDRESCIFRGNILARKGKKYCLLFCSYDEFGILIPNFKDVLEYQWTDLETIWNCLSDKQKEETAVLFDEARKMADKKTYILGCDSAKDKDYSQKW